MKSFKPSALVYMAAIAFLIATVTGINGYALFTGLVLLSFIKLPEGAFFMALQKEIWQKDIVKNLFKDNQFAERAFNADQYVLDGKVVHTPIAGAPAQTKKNLTNFPQTAVGRADDEGTYALDTYYSLPRQIQDIEKYELSYDKRQSIVGEDELQLIQDAMDGLLYRWAPTAANVIVTTGAGSEDDMLEGATGGRKIFTKDEFKKIVKRVANTNNAGRKTALLTANHYHQFLESLTEGEKTNVGAVANMATGVVGRYLNWEIIMRSDVLTYRKVGGIWTVVDRQAEDFAPGAGDSAGSLFYIDNCVERAKGDVKVFEDNGNPLYYGDVFSALMRLGGRIRRASGVYAVVDDIV